MTLDEIATKRGRRKSDLTQGQAAKIIRAAQQAGLRISRILYANGRLEVVTNVDSGEELENPLDTLESLENVESIEDYHRWSKRNGNRA